MAGISNFSPVIVLQVVIALILFLSISQVSSECCRTKVVGYRRLLWSRGAIMACLDGTKGSPCCGRGACNIFCCNCDGGCRHESNRWSLRRFARSSHEHENGQDFDEYDKDQDGHYNFHEARQLLQSGFCGNHTEMTSLELERMFTKFDKNSDGKLSQEELNQDLS